MGIDDPLIGKNLGRYRLVEFVGRGAVARVYKGHHDALGREAAIKVLHIGHASDADFRNQFRAEARNLAALRHPNIVQVYDFDVDAGVSYIVMEYIDGPTLKAINERARSGKRRLELSYSLRIVYSLALALSYAHQRDIIHRDVKPSNVMVEDSGRVVLADFGLARLTTGKSDTLPGTIKGTPAYMSPEQAMGKPSQPRSDIYSLGIIFYELLTGRIPFDGENAFAVAMSHVKESVRPPRELVPEIPEKIEAIVMRALKKEIDQRYSSVNAFIKDLTSVRLQVKTAQLHSSRAADLASESDKNSTWNAPTRQDETGERSVSLHFLDTGQIVHLALNQEYTVGRKHKNQPILPDIDLTPYSSYEWGISRLHAIVSTMGDGITLTDAGSSNGTWHAGKRLPVNQPYELHHGDVFYLGKLRLQILVYD